MEEVKKPSYKYCMVPKCKNTTLSTPDKMFFRIPRDAKLREKWCKMMRRDNLAPLSVVFCCEDHFNVENDMENYVKYKLVSGKLKLKKGIVPHKFACQKQSVEKPERSVVKKLKIAQPTTSSSECIASTSHNIEEIYIVDSIPRVQDIVNDTLKDVTRDENLRRTTEDILKTKHKKIQVCMTCLDTDSDMYSMSEYKLEQAYEDLTGYPLFEMGDLTHTLCEECALSLTNFNKFRDKSLRARALMMDFVKQHKVVSAAALRPLQAALAPRTGEGEPAVKAEGEGEPAVKAEGEGEPAVKAEREVEFGADSVLRDAKLLDEARCRVLLTRMSRAEERALAIRVAPLPARPATNDENNIHPDQTEQDETIVKYEVFDIDDVEADNNDTTDELRVNTLNSCFESTCDALRKSEDTAPEQNETLSTTRKLMCCSDSNTQNNYSDCEDFDTQSTSLGEFQLSEPVATHTGVKVSLNTDTGVANIVKKKHVRSIKGKRMSGISYICDICRRTFRRKNLLVKHIRSHTEENLLTCKLCHDKFENKCFLARHIRTHTSEKPYVCKLCHYKCKWKSILVEHMRTHTGEKPFACKLCQYKCKQKSYLVLHMRTHTGEKPFACKQCHYKCSENSSLVKHMRKHTGEKPFACKQCTYKCSENASLVKHMRTHTGEKPFACKQCTYKCSQKSSLVKHMRTHTGEKPFACKQCTYKCSENSSLVKHMRTHTGEKLFACKQCTYKCSQKSSLVTHMRTHTGEKPFACKQCTYKCSEISSLVKHMRTDTC